jgi:UDP-N-acetylmuramyl pentapeptide synthase
MSEQHALVFKDKAEVKKWLLTQMHTGVLTSGDLILVKGSRGMRMETIIEDLIAEMA